MESLDFGNKLTLEILLNGDKMERLRRLAISYLLMAIDKDECEKIR
jgi:hypothetical protein